MVNSAVRSGLALPIDVPGSAGPSRRALSSTPGDRTVSEAFADTLKARTRASSAGRSVISTPSQETGAGASNVQNPVTASTSSGVSGWSIFGGNTGANAASKPTGASAAATPAASSKTATDGAAAASGPVYANRAEEDAAVVKSLQDALSAAGINTSGLGLAAHEDVVSYPGGSYINRYISVNGRGEGLMTDLVAINPQVAVLDVKRMLGMA